MRSLFFKIFFWFWLTMIVVGLVLVAVTVSTQSTLIIPFQRGLITNALTSYAQTAANSYEQQGRRSLARHLKYAEKQTNIRVFLFSSKGREVSGLLADNPRGVPDTRQLRWQAMRRGQPQFEISFAYILGAQRAVSSSGERYVLLGVMPRGLLGLPRIDPMALALRLLVVLLTGGVLCYMMARHITTPVVKLRAATRKLGQGDLKARVGNAGNFLRRDELVSLARDFDRMADRIEGLINTQHRLLGDISHELRSPLWRLSLALGLARRHSDEGDHAALGRDFDRIEREAERLNTLIGQLLTMSRLESEDSLLSTEAVDMAQLLHEVAENTDFEARSNNRQVRIVRTQPCCVSGNRELLYSALENAVRNAVRYTADTTAVELSLGCEPSSGQGRQRVPPMAHIEVRDHGPGVPPEALADIFRPFYRITQARDRHSGGAGLGLAITERAVRSHGGTVTAANAPDGGLIIALCLPLAA